MGSFQTIIRKNHPEIFQEDTYTPPLSPPDIGTNQQACFAVTHQSNIYKADGIGHIEKASIAPIDME